MLTHQETRFLPYTPEQMKALVLDVESYPKFLPWCVRAHVTHSDEANMVAELEIGFKHLRESYISDIRILENEIRVVSRTGLFKHLTNIWQFEPEKGGCNLSFELDFEFRSRSLQLIMGGVFHKALRLMVRAFESRAEALYSRHDGLPHRQPSRI